MDNTQLHMPGYRDRVVHVFLENKEGGLNLNMPEPGIGALSKRGRKAGALLAKHFGPGSEERLSWDNHRWIRYRSTMDVLENWFQRIWSIFNVWKPPGEDPYPVLIERLR